MASKWKFHVYESIYEFYNNKDFYPSFQLSSQVNIEQKRKIEA